MVTIEMSPIYRFTNPTVLADPLRYYIELAEPGFKVPSVSNQIYANDISSGQERGGPAQIKIRPDEQFQLSDQQFSLLVQSGKGADQNLISALLHLVGQNVLVVKKDGTIQTQTQILNFTA